MCKPPRQLQQATVALNGVTPATTNGQDPEAAKPLTGIRRREGAGRVAGFPMLVDVYLFQQFFYYFFVLLATFVVIFDAFTLFDLLGDISKNHVPVTIVLNYFRFLVPYMVYSLAPLAILVSTLVTLAVLAKNNEVIAFKASGISLYRLILPLTISGSMIAIAMFSLGETYLPYANQRQDALRNEIKGRPAQTYFQPTHQWIFGQGDRIYNYELIRSRQQSIRRSQRFRTRPRHFSDSPPRVCRSRVLGFCGEGLDSHRRLDSRF